MRLEPHANPEGAETAASRESTAQSCLQAADNERDYEMRSFASLPKLQRDAHNGPQRPRSAAQRCSIGLDVGTRAKGSRLVSSLCFCGLPRG